MRHLGKQKPRFRFILNPYSDVRFTRCPRCQGKTKQRKLPLLIHVDPMQLIALNNDVRTFVAAGASPQAALDVRMRGLNAVLPPGGAPGVVTGANASPTGLSGTGKKP